MEDRIGWHQLMREGMNPDEARQLFESELVGQNVLAQSPQGPSSKPWRVQFSRGTDSDHYLFKAEEDTHGRKHALSQRPQDFQAARSARILWITKVLHAPEAIYRKRKQPDTLMYVCRTLPNEQFVVIVQNGGEPPARLFFRTAFSPDLAYWNEQKRYHLLRIFPKQPSKKQK